MLDQDWIADNINEDEVLLLVSQAFNRSIETDSTLVNLIVDRVIDKYRVCDYTIFDYDCHSINEIYDDTFTVSLTWQLELKTKLYYSLGNKSSKITRTYLTNVQMKYLVHKEILIDRKLISIEFILESEE